MKVICVSGYKAIDGRRRNAAVYIMKNRSMVGGFCVGFFVVVVFVFSVLLYLYLFIYLFID